MRFQKTLMVGILILTLFSVSYAGDSTSKISLDVKEFTLKNGMLFLVVERPSTPQVACRIAIRAGSALEDTGGTGIAHLLEHMMFKGTRNFGTSDFNRDQELQEKIEAAYQVILKEKAKREPNPTLIRLKEQEMEALRVEVQKIYVSQAFSSQLSRNGAVGINAFTSKDETQYMTSVPSDMLEQWFSITSEQLFEPSWREFYVEKSVVQREWAFRYINNPGGAAWLDLNATAYTAHPYRNPTIGWKSDMENFNTRDAMAFHAQYYNPKNAVCVLVGDVTLEDARRLARVYFERYPTGSRAPEHVTKEPPQKGPRRSVRHLKGARTPLLRLGFHGARMGTEDFYALDAMTMVLSHGRGARMTQNIINKGLAVQAWAYNPDNRYGGMIILGGSPKEPDLNIKEGVSVEETRGDYIKGCEELEALLLAEVNRLKKDLVSVRELERIKKLNQRGYLDRMRSNEQLAGTLATLEVRVGWQYINEYLDRISKVTPEDIRRVARKYMQPGNSTTVFVIPGGKPDRPPEPYKETRSISGSVAAKMTAPETFENHSIYTTHEDWKHPMSFNRVPRKIEYPKAKTAQIGGAKVFYLPDRDLPLIDLVILVRAGDVDVEEHKLGLTDILNGTIVRGGTDKYTPSELAMLLDENAIQLSVSVGEEESAVRLSVMKEDWERGLKLLEEVLLRPRFDPQILETAKQQALTSLRRQGGDARAVSGRELILWHFKGHPYGRDPLGGLKTIPNITKDELKSFLESYFVPSNMIVAISGDIDRVQAIEGLTGFLEGLKKGYEGVTPERQLDDPPLTPPVLALIHKPGQVQSQVRLAFRSIKRTHPDYWKLGLLMQVLGGNDSLMHKKLRDDLGLVYSTWFFQTYKWQAGMLIGYVGCKADKTVEAIRETINIIRALRKEVPEGELELKRLDTLNSFVFTVDSPVELVETYARYSLRREPLDTLGSIQDAYIRATKEEVTNLAENFLDPRNIQIVIVADKETRIKTREGKEVTLESDLKTLSEQLALTYKELPLR